MTQPPTGPPQGPPPWGNYPAGPPQPTPPSRGWQIFWGAAIGVVASVVLPVAAVALADTTGFGSVFLALLLVPGTGIALVMPETTRPWGIGLLIGWALALVIAGGACVAILSSLE